MVKHKTAWSSILPPGVDPSKLSLDELRNAKLAFDFLTEKTPGPPAIASYVQAFRYLLFFGALCIVEDKYPPLTRCWQDLTALFEGDPMVDEDSFLHAWILMDFPFGPKGQTALDYFEQFIDQTEVRPRFQHFIDAGRKSRLGLYQDVMRTKKVAKFRELFTGRVVSAFPSIETYGKGEILLTRMIEAEGQVFLFGHPKGFPKDTKSQIEDMILDKLFYFDGRSMAEQYEKFMKLAGPYWMSCVTKNDDLPILPPDHFLTYLTGPIARPR